MVREKMLRDIALFHLCYYSPSYGSVHKTLSNSAQISTLSNTHATPIYSLMPLWCPVLSFASFLVKFYPPLKGEPKSYLDHKASMMSPVIGLLSVTYYPCCLHKKFFHSSMPLLALCYSFYLPVHSFYPIIFSY